MAGGAGERGLQGEFQQREMHWHGRNVFVTCDMTAKPSSLVKTQMNAAVTSNP